MTTERMSAERLAEIRACDAAIHPRRAALAAVV